MPETILERKSIVLKPSGAVLEALTRVPRLPLLYTIPQPFETLPWTKHTFPLPTISHRGRSREEDAQTQPR